MAEGDIPLLLCKVESYMSSIDQHLVSISYLKSNFFRIASTFC